MTSKSSSRRAFLLSTLIAMPTLKRRRKVEPPPSQPSQPTKESERERLERLVAHYGSELGELRKAGR